MIMERATEEESLKPHGFDGNVDGYDEAIVGITTEGQLVYSREKMIELCAKQGEMEEIDAIECNTYYETLIRNGGGFLFPSSVIRIRPGILFGKNTYYFPGPALWISDIVWQKFTSPAEFNIVWQNRVHYFILFTGSERSRFREHLPNNIHQISAPETL